MSHETVETVRVEAWGEKQGEFVEINKADYEANPGKYKLFDQKMPPPPKAGAPAAAAPKADGLNFADDEARKLAIESKLDFSKVKGTGAKIGKTKSITVDDVMTHIEASKPKVNFASDEAGEMATEIGLTAEQIAQITGSGENGAITVEDIQTYVDGLK